MNGYEVQKALVVLDGQDDLVLEAVAHAASVSDYVASLILNDLVMNGLARATFDGDKDTWRLTDLGRLALGAREGGKL